MYSPNNKMSHLEEGQSDVTSHKEEQGDVRSRNSDQDSSWEAPGILETDITLIVERKKIKCHKKVLSEKSEYFSAMFNSNMKESLLDEIELQDTDFESFKKLMIYIYGDATILESTGPDTIQDKLDLLIIASIYQSVNILDDVSLAIESSIDIHNCAEIMNVADMHGLSKLKKKAAKFCLFHLNVVVEPHYFLHLHKGCLLQILKTESLDISENELLQAVEKWILFDQDTRQNIVYELLECLRLGCISSNALQALQTKAYLASSDSLQGKSKKLIDAILSAKTQPKEQTDLKVYFTPRRKLGECLFYVGGYMARPSRSEEDRDNIDNFLDEDEDDDFLDADENDDFLDEDDDFLEKDSIRPVLIRKINLEMGKLREMADKGCAICCQGRNVLFIGGGYQSPGKWSSSSWMYEIRKFDSLTETWSTLASLLDAVHHHSAVTLGKYLYVIGGVAGEGMYRNKLLNSVKRVHMEKGFWEKMPKLSWAMSRASACVLNDTIYVVIKDRIEYFNPDTDSFWHVAPTAHSFYGVLTCFPGNRCTTIICILREDGTTLIEVDTENWSCIEIRLCRKKCKGATRIGNHLFISLADDGMVHCYDMQNRYKLLYKEKLVDAPLGSSIFTLPDFDLYKLD